MNDFIRSSIGLVIFMVIIFGMAAAAQVQG